MDYSEKCCCSKEGSANIPFGRVLDKLDAFYSKNDLNGAERLLDYWSEEAKKINDQRGLLEILSEYVGLYRRTLNREKGLAVCSEAIGIIYGNGLEQTVSGSTILLNCATTMKSFGMTDQAMKYYEQAEKIFKENLDENDKRMAGLCNNKATALSELGKTDDAKELYLKAISILKHYDDSYPEIAVSYVNMAQMLNLVDPFDEQPFIFMDEAWNYLNMENMIFDSNYAFVASKCAPAFKEMGFFDRANQLEDRSRRIYAGDR